MDPQSPTPGRKRPIQVIVTGPRGSGKTTLISVLAHALRGSGHIANVQPHVPPASVAIADLHEQFDITFHEAVLPDSAVIEILEADQIGFPEEGC